MKFITFYWTLPSDKLRCEYCSFAVVVAVAVAAVLLRADAAAILHSQTQHSHFQIPTPKPVSNVILSGTFCYPSPIHPRSNSVRHNAVQCIRVNTRISPAPRHHNVWRTNARVNGFSFDFIRPSRAKTPNAGACWSRGEKQCRTKKKRKSSVRVTLTRYRRYDRWRRGVTFRREFFSTVRSRKTVGRPDLCSAQRRMIVLSMTITNIKTKSVVKSSFLTVDHRIKFYIVYMRK